MAENPQFNVTFFSNLRALGEIGAHHFSYLLASYHPLETLLKDQGKGGSSFWNIFGLPWTLGLLEHDEARQLIEIPLCLTLENPPVAPFELIAELAGNHPALIQMLMANLWRAWQSGHEPDMLNIRSGLRHYYGDLWNRRSPTEQSLLSCLAVPQPKPIPQTSTLEELQLRGLVTSENRLFADAYAEFVQEQQQNSISISPKPQEEQNVQSHDQTGDKLPDSQINFAKDILKSAIEAVPAVKYALGVAGIAAAASLIWLLLRDWRTAFFSILGMFFFMGILFIFADLSKTIPKSAQLTFIWFLLVLFMAICAMLFFSVFFQWPLPLGTWAVA